MSNTQVDGEKQVEFSWSKEILTFAAAFGVSSVHMSLNT